MKGPEDKNNAKHLKLWGGEGVLHLPPGRLSFKDEADMKIDRFDLMMFVVTIGTLLCIVGLIALSSYIGRRYGANAAMAVVLLPVFTTTIALVIMLLKHPKDK